jgi:hypothetical protein
LMLIRYRFGGHQTCIYWLRTYIQNPLLSHAKMVVQIVFISLLLILLLCHVQS